MFAVVGRTELGDCPAASMLDNEGRALFVLNRDTFPLMGAGEKRFILGHELGHLLLDTDDEQLADAFALGLTAGRHRDSLRHAVQAVGRMEAVPASRVAHLLELCQWVERKRL